MMSCVRLNATPERSQCVIKYGGANGVFPRVKEKMNVMFNLAMFNLARDMQYYCAVYYPTVVDIQA
jgi:hypothetical protein